MSEYKDNWREYHPPTIPIYFIGLEELKEMLDRDPRAVSSQGLDQMLGFFEEYEKFEKAAVVRDARMRLELFEEEPLLTTEQPNVPNFPKPNDGHEWIPSPDGTYWMREVTQEYLNNIIDNQNDDINFSADDLREKTNSDFANIMREIKKAHASGYDFIVTDYKNSDIRKKLTDKNFRITDIDGKMRIEW